MRNYSFGL
uniref:Allatostatin-2 n=1 Tax=Rhodnius prolixus TaxID=13249 RepID=ALL2_RHOPR|nr:RecName: Full=Allatostatin-2; Short=Rhopr-AST-2 [Rhodnius prolixus]